MSPTGPVTPAPRFPQPKHPDAEFPATWLGGHALVIEFADEQALATCQCSQPIGAGDPTTSLDEFGLAWERHVMTRKPA